MYVVTLNIIQSISYLKVYSNVPWQSGGKFFYKTVGVVEHYFINFYDSNNIPAMVTATLLLLPSRKFIS